MRDIETQEYSAATASKAYVDKRHKQTMHGSTEANAPKEAEAGAKARREKLGTDPAESPSQGSLEYYQENCISSK
jgi:hypothetical protein